MSGRASAALSEVPGDELDEGPAAAQGRVSYVEAGAAHRRARAAGVAAGLTPTQTKVLDVVIELTVSYSKLEDDVSVRRVAEMAGIPGNVETRERATRRALQHLAKLGIITYRPGDGRRPSRVGLPVVRGGASTSPPTNYKEGSAQAPPGGADPVTEGGLVEAPQPRSNTRVPPLPPRTAGGRLGYARRKPTRPGRRGAPEPLDAMAAAQAAAGERHAAYRRTQPPRSPQALERLRAAKGLLDRAPPAPDP